MSTTLDASPGDGTTSVRGEQCQVAILYEATADRERALSLSHSLVERFWQDVDFGFSWWRFRYLEDPDIAEAAIAAAARADIVVVAAPVADEPSSTVRDWLALWTLQRAEGPGVLLPLLHPPNAEDLSASPWMSLLEDLARQTGMDCLLPAQLKDSPLFTNPSRPIRQRADHVSGVLDHILHTTPHAPSPPSHWGLNE